MPGVALFLCCLLLGVVARLWFVGLLNMEKKIGRPAAIVLEFLSMGLLAAVFLVIMFFLSDGVFMPFTFLAAAVGFVTTSIFV
ncbi:MAG: hypothetical protein FWE84_03775 [Firmicutes bacterium]|nr:hypothetical protein [Bacillota bacterium]